MIGELMSLMLVFVPAIIFLIDKMLKGEKATTYHYIWVFTFSFYIGLVFFITGLGTIWDIIDKGGLVLSIQSAKINLIPFASEGAFTYIMNIIMFIPLGFLLPYIWKNYRNIYKIAITGLLFSSFIEISQIPTNREVDIDDLIMNTIGAVLGYAIWKAIGKVFFNKNEEKRTKELSKIEPIIYMVLACTLHFFYNGKWFM